MADPWQTAYDFAVQVARAAGAVRKKNEPRPTSPTLTPEPRANALLFVQVIRKAGEEEIKIQTKSSAVDLVTKTDERVEKIIIGSLKEQFGDGTHWSVSHTHTDACLCLLHLLIFVIGSSVLQFHWRRVRL